MALTRKHLIPVDLIKKRDFNVKITKIVNKMPNFTGLGNTAARNAVENKLPSISYVQSWS